jgi:hypothetical protein
MSRSFRGVRLCEARESSSWMPADKDGPLLVAGHLFDVVNYFTDGCRDVVHPN